MILNQSLLATPPSGIRRIGMLARSIPGCIALSIGEPDLDAPLSVRRKIADRLLDGDTHYPPNPGTNELRDELAAHLRERFGCEVTRNEVVFTIGSTEAIAATLFAILNPGDEVILPSPCFGLYQPLVQMAGGRAVILDIEKDGFAVRADRLAALRTEKTKAVLFASPNNPTGEVLSGESLDVLRNFALQHDVFLLADSVYDQLVYDGAAPSLMADPSIRDRFVYLSALSKTYAMTGVRLGYAAADEPVMAQIIKAHSFLTVSAPAFVLHGCEGVFSIDPEPMREIYRKRRDLVHRRLVDMGLPVRLPRGAFYIYPDISMTGLTDETFCDRLMHEAGLALIPSSCFGGEGHVRISYCYGTEQLEEGMNRLSSFLQILRKEGRL